MAREKPVFPMQLEYEQFGHCGFDPEMEYLQILEEARKPCKQENGSPDSLRFFLKKPISNEDPKRRPKIKKRRKWWRNPLLFLKWRRADGGVKAAPPAGPPRPRQSFSGQVYLTESNATAPSTPYRRKSCSGPLKSSEIGDLKIPYVCLRDPLAAIVSSPALPSNAMPIYLIT